MLVILGSHAFFIPNTIPKIYIYIFWAYIYDEDNGQNEMWHWINDEIAL